MSDEWRIVSSGYTGSDIVGSVFSAGMKTWVAINVESGEVRRV